VLISNSTFERCRDFVETSEPMTLHVKGKPNTVSVRRVLSIPNKGLQVPRQEIRRSHRVEVRLPFTYQPIRGGIVMPEMLYGVIYDIGYYGVLVQLSAPQPPMTEMKMSTDLSHVSYLAKNIYGKVVNQKTRHNRILTGVEFTSVPAAVNTKIQLFVQLLVYSD